MIAFINQPWQKMQSAPGTDLQKAWQLLLQPLGNPEPPGKFEPQSRSDSVEATEVALLRCGERWASSPHQARCTEGHVDTSMSQQGFQVTPALPGPSSLQCTGGPATVPVSPHHEPESKQASCSNPLTTARSIQCVQPECTGERGCRTPLEKMPHSFMMKEKNILETNLESKGSCFLNLIKGIYKNSHNIIMIDSKFAFGDEEKGKNIH